MKVKKAVTAEYPCCEICFKSMRRPCTIAISPDKGWMVCGACYTLWMRMQAFATMGLISFEGGTNE